MISKKEQKRIRENENARLWRLRNPERAREVAMRFRLKHKDRLNREAKEKRKSDPVWRARKLRESKKWRDNNKERFALMKKKSILKNTYGISIEIYDQMVKEQGGVCAICKGLFKEYKNKKTNLCVDHDHKNNKVRGILCHSCNRGLGLLKDNVSVLSEAIIYLKKYNVRLEELPTGSSK